MEAGSGTGFLMLEVTGAVEVVVLGGDGADVTLRKEAGRCAPIDKLTGGSCPTERLVDGEVPIERAAGGDCPSGRGVEDDAPMESV